MQALSGITKDQRREYKSKFVDMDIEFQRMKERLETIHLILDDMQVCMVKSYRKYRYPMQRIQLTVMSTPDSIMDKWQKSSKY